MSNDSLNSAIIGATGSINSAIVSNAGNRRSQERANKHNIEFWRMQNEYNNPTSQMQRLRDAGLNPNLIYGSGTTQTGNADRIAPSKASPYEFDSPIQDIARFADTGVKNAQADNLKTQNTVLTQEAILKGAQTAKLGTETAQNKFDYNLATELRDTSLQAAKENLRNLEQNTIGRQLDNDFKDQALKNRVKDIFFRVQNAKENLKGSQLLNQLRQLEIDLKKIGIERNDPWYFRIFGRNIEAIKDDFQKSGAAQQLRNLKN